MTKVLIEGKELNLVSDEQKVSEWLKAHGGSHVDKIETKEILKAVDPLTVGIFIVSAGAYAWYRFTNKEQLDNLKKSIKY